MPKQVSYQDQRDKNNRIKIKEQLSELPYFVSDYIESRTADTTTLTRLGYVYDIKNFLFWFSNQIPILKNEPLKKISIHEIRRLNSRDINAYLNDVSLGQVSDKNNGQASVARKFAAINSFFDFLYCNDYISENPCTKAKSPKVSKDLRIIKLAPDETAILLDAIEFGKAGSFTDKQRKYLDGTRTRDLAIATLLLGTGIRVSECVSLDLSDLDFKEYKIHIQRKGGKHQNIAMGDEVITALQQYLKIRNQTTPLPGYENALFLSLQRKRMCVEAVENMIKKYSKALGFTKNITPHKLRKTYGTELYAETGDIYLVARALGHNSVNTTKNHYIEADEQSLLDARNKVKLR